MATKRQLHKNKSEISLECDILSDGEYDGRWISQWKSVSGIKAVEFGSVNSFQGWTVKQVDEKVHHRTFSKKLDKEFFLGFTENKLCMHTLEKEQSARVFALETDDYTPFEGDLLDEGPFFIKDKDTQRYIAIDNDYHLLVATNDPKNAVLWKLIFSSEDSNQETFNQKKGGHCNIL